MKLFKAGLPTDALNKDGTLDMDFEELATEYWVRTVPGSLVEMEDEKQLRILNQLFVPLSQAMPALAATENRDMLMQAAKAMQYIIGKQIELSGSTSAKDLGLLWEGDIEAVDARDQKISAVEEAIHGVEGGLGTVMEMNDNALRQMQEQISMLRESQQLILEKLGGLTETPGNTQPVSTGPSSTGAGQGPTVMPASA